MDRLNPGEVEAYEDNGFVVPEFRLSGDRVQELKDALDRVMEANPHVRPEKLIGIHIRDSHAEGVTGDSAFLNIARDEEILDMVEQLIGPDIILWGCQAFCKPPRRRQGSFLAPGWALLAHMRRWRPVRSGSRSTIVWLKTDAFGSFPAPTAIKNCIPT